MVLTDKYVGRPLEDLLDVADETGDLRLLMVNKDGCCSIYENEDIEWIDAETLSAIVEKYEIIKIKRSRGKLALDVTVKKGEKYA